MIFFKVLVVFMANIVNLYQKYQKTIQKDALCANNSNFDQIQTNTTKTNKLFIIPTQILQNLQKHTSKK